MTINGTWTSTTVVTPAMARGMRIGHAIKLVRNIIVFAALVKAAAMAGPALAALVLS